MRNTIKKHKDFIPGDNDVSVKTPLFIVRRRETRFEGDARYGLVVTKKTMKLATDRNRAKRLLRVWIRECDGLLRDDMDYIFIARRDILDASRDIGINTMNKALTTVNK